jgi:hypothetical protein
MSTAAHGHHVPGACGKNAVLRMYEKFTTFLRLEALDSNLKDFGLKKAVENLGAVREKLAAVIDRFAGFEGRGAQRPRRFSPLPAHGSRAAHACPESRSTTRA